MADGVFLVTLGQGATAVRVRSGRDAPYSVWVCWHGDSVLMQHEGRTWLACGRGHLTIMFRDRQRAPSVEVVEALMVWGDTLYPQVGGLTIAGPPYARPRHEGNEFPALYVVHVGTRAHGFLSSLLNRMEQRLHLEHVHRISFDLSLDEEPVRWELVD